MNFVNHLQRINRLFRKDERIHQEHVSLYSALFNWWYHHRQGAIVSISHKKIMRDSAIVSKQRYEQVLSELHDYGYLNFNAGPPATIGITNLYAASPEPTGLFQLPVIRNPRKDDAMKQLVREIVERIVLLRSMTRR